MSHVLDQWDWQHPGSDRMYRVTLLERPRPGDPDRKERQIEFEAETGARFVTETELESRDEVEKEKLQHLLAEATEPGEARGEAAPPDRR